MSQEKQNIVLPQESPNPKTDNCSKIVQQLLSVPRNKAIYKTIDMCLTQYQFDLEAKNQPGMDKSQKEIENAFGLLDSPFPYRIPEYRALQEYIFLAKQEVRRHKLIADLKTNAREAESFARTLPQVRGTVQFGGICLKASDIASITLPESCAVVIVSVKGEKYRIGVSDWFFSVKGLELYYEYLVAHWKYSLND